MYVCMYFNVLMCLEINENSFSSMLSNILTLKKVFCTISSRSKSVSSCHMFLKSLP